MTLFGAFFLNLLLFRKKALATVAIALALTLAGLGGENFALETTAPAVSATLGALVISRYGLLASVGTFYAVGIFQNIPLPIAPGAPYTPHTIIVLAGFAVLAIYAFRVSLGPRSVFNLALDD